MGRELAEVSCFIYCDPVGRTPVYFACEYNLPATTGTLAYFPILMCDSHGQGALFRTTYSKEDHLMNRRMYGDLETD